MEMSQLGGGALAADITITSSNAPVYNSTTIPLTGNGNNNNNTKTPIDHQQSQTGSTAEEADKFDLRTFNNLPARKPVDIQFKDISYCVKAGFRKGELGFVLN